MASRAGRDSLGNLSGESERDLVGEHLCVDLVPVMRQFSHRLMAASKWLQRELLACDLLYWLIFEHDLKCKQIAEGLTAYTSRWIAMEFTPGIPLDDLLLSFRQGFHNVELVVRTSIFVCEK